MEVLLILWLTFAVSPPLAHYLLRRVTITQTDKQRLSKTLLCFCALYLLGLITGISTTFVVVDILFFSVSYFTIIYLLMWLFKSSRGIKRIVTIIVITVTVVVSYLTCSLGFVVLTVVSAEIAPEDTFYMSDNLIVKQHNLGFATSEYRGIRFDLYKSYRWLPFMERKVLSKDVDIWGNGKYKLDSYNFDVSYDKGTKAVIISDKKYRNEISIP